MHAFVAKREAGGGRREAGSGRGLVVGGAEEVQETGERRRRTILDNGGL